MSDDKPGKRLLFFFELNPNSVLLLASFVFLYMFIGSLYNSILSSCWKIIVPFIIAGFFHLLGGALLFLGVICHIRFLVKGFPWLMMIVLMALIAFTTMVYVEQECLATNAAKLDTDNVTAIVGTYIEYSMTGFLSGINYVVTLYGALLVFDYLTEDDD